MSVIMSVIQAALWVWTPAWILLQHIWKQVLQSTASPLEICACVVIMDTGEHEAQKVHIALVAIILFLTATDWHVPLTLPGHYTDADSFRVRVCKLYFHLPSH